jgi:hypothetical protein
MPYSLSSEVIEINKEKITMYAVTSDDGNVLFYGASKIAAEAALAGLQSLEEEE